MRGSSDGVELSGIAKEKDGKAEMSLTMSRETWDGETGLGILDRLGGLGGSTSSDLLFVGSRSR